MTTLTGSPARSQADILATADRLAIAARRLLTDGPVPSPASMDDVGRLKDRLAAAIAASDGDDARVTRLLALAMRARSVEDEGHRADLTRRAHLHERVEEGLARIRQLGSSAEMIDHVCEEAVNACGFARAMLSRVEHGTWYPWMTYFSEHLGFEDEFHTWTQTAAMPFGEMTLEAQVLETRRAALVEDTSSDPRVLRPLAAPGGTTSYVVAPITPAGRVVGLLHCDHYATDRVADATDRDALWTFVEGFGRAYERAVIHERLIGQRTRVRAAFTEAEEIMASLAHTEIELVRDEEHDWDDVELLGDSRSRQSIDRLLTEREREVLSMIVQGKTNQAIAEHLVIREGTVKSHVKHILRKVGAVNRTQAITLYLGTTPDGP
jgi:DNA-binding CsgD family transcriptional regulator/putative methionine-R-sulfoxide reductase with GAF domain